MPDSFGARLRRKREEQRIGLDAVAADTKIKLSLLEALERDDVSSWPAGIFRRAYVRAYARAVRLPAEELVAEFLAIYPERDTSHVPLSASLPKSAEADTWRERIRQFGRLGVQSDARASDAPSPSGSPRSDAPGMTGQQEPETPGPSEHPMSAPDTTVPAEPAQLRVDESAPGVAEAGSPAAPLASSPESTFALDLVATAAVCTALSQVATANDLVRTLAAAATLMHASGVIVWLWDRSESALVAAFAHGYRPNALARLEPISDASDNATAAAFRSGELCVVKRTDRHNGALVAPLMGLSSSVHTLQLDPTATYILPLAKRMVRVECPPPLPGRSTIFFSLPARNWDSSQSYCRTALISAT